MLRLRKTSQTAALRRSSTDAVRSPVSPRTPGKSAGECTATEAWACAASSLCSVAPLGAAHGMTYVSCAVPSL